MIRTLSGTITHLMSDGIVVNVGGVGYLVSVTPRSMSQIGTTADLFTYHHIREDDQALYGFSALEELQLFRELLTVPSIGPKLALAILSAAAPADILAAIEQDNLSFFQSLSGVGKKSAAKIIVELKGKLTGTRLTAIPQGRDELVSALTQLGYRSDEIQPIIQALPADLEDTQSQLTWSLKQLAR